MAFLRLEGKGTGPICRNGPEGASHKLDLSPFSPVGSPIEIQALSIADGRRSRRPPHQRGAMARHAAPALLYWQKNHPTGRNGGLSWGRLAFPDAPSVRPRPSSPRLPAKDPRESAMSSLPLCRPCPGTTISRLELSPFDLFQRQFGVRVAVLFLEAFEFGVQSLSLRGIGRVVIDAGEFLLDPFSDRTVPNNRTSP